MSFTGPQSRLATPLLLQYNHILIKSLLYTKAQEPIAKKPGAGCSKADEHNPGLT